MQRVRQMLSHFFSLGSFLGKCSHRQSFSLLKSKLCPNGNSILGFFLGKIMDIISGLPDELLVKILSFLPTKKVVSTSILSKRWESLWMWVPKLELVINHHESDLPLRDFITKNLSLLKRPVLESFHLQCYASTFQPEDINQWIGTTVSRCVRELTIKYLSILEHPDVLLPSSLYRCKSLVILRLDGKKIIVDVPGTVDLPCLKTLELGRVTYSKEDSLKLLLSYCIVLENLSIDQYGNEDNVKTIVINVPSLLRLTLELEGGCDRYVIVTPCLKYFKVDEFYSDSSYSNARMPQVEEADLSLYEHVERHFKPITSVKRFSLSVLEIYKNEQFLHRNGIVFNRLEHLKLRIKCYNWSKLLVWLLQGSPKLRVLKILNEIDLALEEEYWYNIQSCVPTCLLESLETFEFRGYRGTQEERDVVCFILQNAPHLKSSSISHIYNSE